MRMSDSVMQLATALAKFQAEVKNPKNTAKNPQFTSKYAPLGEILELVRPLLGKHGLSIMQDTGGTLEDITITTRLLHESGEWLESEPLHFKGEQMLKGGGSKLSVQGAGSCITYGRRYQVTAMLGLAGNDDDDGNSASESNRKGKGQLDNADPDDDSEEAANKKIDNVKIKSMRSLLEATNTDEKLFLNFYHIEKIEDMTNKEYLRGMNSLDKKYRTLQAENAKAAEQTDEKLNI